MIVPLKNKQLGKNSIRQLQTQWRNRMLYSKSKQNQIPLEGNNNKPSSGEGPQQTVVQISNCHRTLYTGTISIGTPPQEFEVSIDINYKDMWVPAKECRRGCKKNWHNFDPLKSETFSELIENSFESSVHDKKIVGYKGLDTVRIGDSELKNQIFGVVNTFPSGFNQCEDVDGILGLGLLELSYDNTYPTVIENLSSSMRKPIFSLYLRLTDEYEESTGRPYAASSMLILGGVDMSLYKGCLRWKRALPRDEVSARGIAEFSWVLPNVESRIGSQLITPVLEIMFDTTLPGLVGPLDEVMSFIKANNAECVYEDDDSKMLVVDCGHKEFKWIRVDCVMENFVPLVFVIDGEQYSFGLQDLILKESKEQDKCNLLLMLESTDYESIDYWVFGIPWFNKYYTAFDMQSHEVGFAPRLEIQSESMLALENKDLDSDCDVDKQMDVTLNFDDDLFDDDKIVEKDEKENAGEVEFDDLFDDLFDDDLGEVMDDVVDDKYFDVVDGDSIYKKIDDYENKAEMEGGDGNFHKSTEALVEQVEQLESDYQDYVNYDISVEQIDDYEYLGDEDNFHKNTEALVEQALAEQAVQKSDEAANILMDDIEPDYDNDHEAVQKYEKFYTDDDELVSTILMDDMVDDKLDENADDGDDDNYDDYLYKKTKITSQKSNDEDKSHSDDHLAATKAYKEKYSDLYAEEEKEWMREKLIEQSLYESEFEEKNKELEIFEGLGFGDDDFESEEESLDGILEKHEFDQIGGDDDPYGTYFNTWTDTLNYARDDMDDYLTKLAIEEEKIQKEEVEDQREDIIYKYDDMIKFSANIKMDDEVEQDDNLPARDDDDAWAGNGEAWVVKGDSFEKVFTEVTGDQSRHTWAAAAIFFLILYLAYYIKRKWGYRDQDRYRGYHQTEIEIPRMEQEYEENTYDDEVDDERCGLLGN